MRQERALRLEITGGASPQYGGCLAPTRHALPVCPTRLIRHTTAPLTCKHRHCGHTPMRIANTTQATAIPPAAYFSKNTINQAGQIALSDAPSGVHIRDASRKPSRIAGHIRATKDPPTRAVDLLALW